MHVIGVMGGSGLYEMDGFEDIEKIVVSTPFGNPSDEVFRGKLKGRPIAFLSRHGRGHRLLPSEINYRANVFAMKKLGVSFLISISAVGSMKESIKPGEFVFPDQFIDLTKRRQSTFFGDGIVGHVAMAEPVCPILTGVVAEAARSCEMRVHAGGTYLCIEGPQFSTKAESKLYRTWGVDVIGMTNATEAKLAREAEMSYCSMSLVTDYDCWHESEESVSVDAILQILHRNVDNAKKTLAAAVGKLDDRVERKCLTALKHAVITDLKSVSSEKIAQMEPLLGRYFSATGKQA